MRAMVLNKIVDIKENNNPLSLDDVPIPSPDTGEILIRVKTCGVCHTELDEIEGRTPPPVLPVIPGHQVVGVVEELGDGAIKHKPGTRVGIAWIFSSCGECKYCVEGNDNLCPGFRATGRDANGGYAEYMTVSEDFAYEIPEVFSDTEAAPLLCAGAIGYRSLRLTNLKDGGVLGLTGFGSSAHLTLKMAKHIYPNSEVYVFARSKGEREFALELGANWAGNTGDIPPRKLNAVIDTTPVWKPILESLKNLDSGGRLVINAIRKEESDKDHLLNLDYATHLWMEKEIKSVANISRRDVLAFLRLAAEIPIKPKTQEYPLEEANLALTEMKERKIKGAKVLVIS